MDLSIFTLSELLFMANSFKVKNYSGMGRQKLEAVLKRQFPDVFKKRKLPKKAIKTLPKGTKLYYWRNVIVGSTDHDSKKTNFVDECRPCFDGQNRV